MIPISFGGVWVAVVAAFSIMLLLLNFVLCKYLTIGKFDRREVSSDKICKMFSEFVVNEIGIIEQSR